MKHKSKAIRAYYKPSPLEPKLENFGDLMSFMRARAAYEGLKAAVLELAILLEGEWVTPRKKRARK